MQIRCTHCTKTVALAASGEIPASCPHCAQRPGPGPLGPYEPLRLIAAGGMGEVYLARHRELGTEVAVKVLPAMPLDAIPALRERFAREARLTAKVRHAGVVKVHGDDVAGDRPYLVLEYVAGQTLRERLRAGLLPVVEAARLAAATADVLAAAHHEGVLHRDIKPDNVMVTPDGEVRVLDFGIARGLQDDAPITRTGEIVGTPEYMAPEQLLDGPDAITERTDVHALGVLLHELLTGRSPFHGANVFQALKLVESLVPPPPSSLRAEVPKELDAVVAHALQKEPALRCPSATAFAAAVRTAMPGLAVPRRRPSPWRWIALTCAALLLAGGVGFYVVLQSIAATLGQALHATPQVVATLVRNTFDAVSVELWLHGGHWQRTLVASEEAANRGGPDLPSEPLRHAARQALLLSQTAWPLAAGAPPWLAATANRQSQRWFGDGLEPATTDAGLAACLRMLAGDGDIAGQSLPGPSGGRAESRLHLLSRHFATADPVLLRPLHHDAGLVDDALSRLLRIRLLPPAERAEAFGSYARRQPLDEPEHWLARTIERHGQGDHDGGTQAAEMAWLSGAGELAIALDAWLWLQPIDGGAGLRPLLLSAFTRLRARLAAADAEEAPACVLLQVVGEALHGIAPDPRRTASLPQAFRAAARRWLVQAAVEDQPRLAVYLPLAVRLGAVPAYDDAPWRDANADLRRELDAEATRGR